MDEKLKKVLFDSMATKQEESVEVNKAYRNLYETHSEACIGEIEKFLNNYASKERISRNEALRRVSEMDVVKFAEKAKAYVEYGRQLAKDLGRNVTYSDFSPEVNAELRLYNLKLKMSRLELLNKNLELSILKLGDAEHQMTERYLRKEYVEELNLQAGIMQMTIHSDVMNAKMMETIINTPVEKEIWSDRIWSNKKELAAKVTGIVEKGMIQGKSAAELSKAIKKEFNVKAYQASRLAVTEMARVATSVQKEVGMSNGFEEYDIHPEPTACDICKEAASHNPYRYEDLKYRDNAPPFHPWCRCAIAPNAKKLRDEIEEMKKMVQGEEGVDVNSTAIKDQFQTTFADFKDTDNKRKLAQEILSKLNLTSPEIKIHKIKNANGQVVSTKVSDRFYATSFELNSRDGRAIEYQKKTAFHEAYHAMNHGRRTDRGNFGLFSWTDIEETFAEASSHYAVEALGITKGKKLAPSYPDKLIETLPRLKKLDEFKDCKTIADFGKIAWNKKLAGGESLWKDLAKELENVNFDSKSYALSYKKYMIDNKEVLVDKILENMPGYNFDAVRTSMKADLESALEKLERLENVNELYANEKHILGNFLINAMNNEGVK